METTARLMEQPELVELIAVLQSNGMEKEKQEVETLARYLENMEDQFSEVLMELKEVRGQLNAIQDKGIRAAALRVADKVETKVTEVKAQVLYAKNNLVKSAAHAVNTFKEHGISAFKKALAAMHMPEALAHIRDGLHSCAEAAHQGALKVTEISRELHEAGEHAKNAGRALAGKASREPAAHQPDKGVLGRFQKLLIGAGRLCARMEKTSETAIEKMKQKKPSVKEDLKIIRLEQGEKRTVKDLTEQVR